VKETMKKIIDKFWTLSDKFDYEEILINNTKPFQFEKPKFTEEDINQSYKNDNEKWTHSEYVKILRKRIIIEPEYSYCITDFNKIISSSAFYPKLTPSFPKCLIYTFLKTKNKYFTKALLFDGQVGCNYFHFFSDIVNKLWLIKNIENEYNIPIIIGEKHLNLNTFNIY